MDEIVSTHARKSRVAEIKRDIRTIDETVGREQWRFGTVLHEVVRDALFREDGCETFGDWLETEDVGTSPSSASRPPTRRRLRRRSTRP